MMVLYGFPGLAGSLAEQMAHRGSQGRISIVFYSFLLRFSIVVYGFPMVFLWASLVFFDVLWFSYGVRLFSCGFLMGFYCFFCCFPMA